MSPAASEPAHPLAALNAARRDPLWWGAVSAGPVVWLLLVVAGTPMPDGYPAVSVLLFGVLIYPVLEEFVFRGLLQSSLLHYPALTRRVGPVSLANLATSSIFATSHLYSQPPAQAFSVLLPSLVFGWALERYRHFAPCIVLHAVYNAGFLWLFAS